MQKTSSSLLLPDLIKSTPYLHRFGQHRAQISAPVSSEKISESGQNLIKTRLWWHKISGVAVWKQCGDIIVKEARLPSVAQSCDVRTIIGYTCVVKKRKVLSEFDAV